MEIVHKPVLLKECLHYLSPIGEPYENRAVMIDSTLGEGGHTYNFLSKYPNLSVIGLDADKYIQARAKERLSIFGDRIHFYNGWFNDFYDNYPDEYEKPDLILFDLGISVYHYEKSSRGFSFRYDEQLDMRLNENSEKSAADLVNDLPEDKLADLIYLYGEEKLSRKIAAAIVKARAGGRIESSKALAQIIWDAVPANYRYGQIHPATRTFQALRIAVNSELKRLPGALHAAFNDLKVGGKMGVITFHSLEDRICKKTFKEKVTIDLPKGLPFVPVGYTISFELLTPKAITASAEELLDNNRSHSAKLRAIKRISK